MDKRKDIPLDNTTPRSDGPDTNPDPITGAPGSHPIGTGVGAAAGGAAGIGAAAAAGAAMGSAVGPIGTAIGAAVGAVAGGLVGKGIAENINPTAEQAYWRENFSSRPYVRPGSNYEDYSPAYQYGWESRGRNPDRNFDDVEPDLGRDWNQKDKKCDLNWDQARDAAHDAWDHVTPPPRQP